MASLAIARNQRGRTYLGMNKKTQHKKRKLQHPRPNQARPLQLKEETGSNLSFTRRPFPQPIHQEKKELMSNRAIAQGVEKFLDEVGHIRSSHRGYMQTLDALTGTVVTCKLGVFNGQRAAAIIIGDEPKLICLTLPYIEDVLKRATEQSQFSPTAPTHGITKSATAVDPSSGTFLEATLIAIEGEELIEIFMSNRVEPLVLEPGFLVEMMLDLYK